MQTCLRRPSILVAILAGVALGGCFKSPDLADLKCTNDQHCPGGYACTPSQAGQPWMCVKTASGNDVGADVVFAAEGGAAADAPVASDVVTVVDIAPAVEVAPAADFVDASDAIASLDLAIDLHRDAPMVPADGGPTGHEAGADTPSGKPRGANCVLSSECADAVCADGRCCDRVCAGTCEACDLATSPGTCTPLGKGASPRPGHGACEAADPACAGSCDGVSGACANPTAVCAGASCIGKTYQAPGICNAGACVLPASQPCPANQSCSGNTCACVSPSLACAGSCADARNDPKNCGACGHDCLGGSCNQGRCQPVVIAGNLDVGGAGVFALDSIEVYYMSYGVYPAVETRRISKSATSGVGSLVSASCSVGVIGTRLFQCPNRGIGTSCDVARCTSTVSRLPGDGQALRFGSPYPKEYVILTTDLALNTNTFVWYDTADAVVGEFSETFWTGASVSDGWAAGSSVYWMETAVDAAGTPVTENLYTVDLTSKTRARLAADLGNVFIADVNQASIFLQDNSAGGQIQRVPLPLGTGDGPPPRMIEGVQVSAITEDQRFVYWIDDAGTMYSCVAADCATSKAVIANGQVIQGRLLQDEVALYWATLSPSQVVRMAKP